LPFRCLAPGGINPSLSLFGDAKQRAGVWAWAHKSRTSECVEPSKNFKASVDYVVQCIATWTPSLSLFYIFLAIQGTSYRLREAGVLRSNRFLRWFARTVKQLRALAPVTDDGCSFWPRSRSITCQHLHSLTLRKSRRPTQQRTYRTRPPPLRTEVPNDTQYGNIPRLGQDARHARGARSRFVL